jgi:hypothetical protein
MTAEQLDLTDPALLARSTDPDTSHAGAVDVTVRAGTQRARLLASYLRNPVDGLTDHEAADYAYLTQAGYWKRCAELRRDGLIEPAGSVYGPAGSLVMLCRITSAGIRALG